MDHKDDHQYTVRLPMSSSGMFDDPEMKRQVPAENVLVTDFMDKILKKFNTSMIEDKKNPPTEAKRNMRPDELKRERDEKKHEKTLRDTMESFLLIRNTMEVTPTRNRRDNFSRYFTEMLNHPIGHLPGASMGTIQPGQMAYPDFSSLFGTGSLGLPAVPGAMPPPPHAGARRLNLMNLFSSLGFDMMPMAPLEDVKTPLKKDTLDKMPVCEYKEIKASTNHNSCAICRDDFGDTDKVNTLPCQHLFHVDCIASWLKEYNHICPVCRASCGGYDVKSN